MQTWRWLFWSCIRCNCILHRLKIIFICLLHDEHLQFLADSNTDSGWVYLPLWVANTEAIHFCLSAPSHPPPTVIFFLSQFYLLPPGCLNYAAMPLTLNENAFRVIVSHLSLFNSSLHSVPLLHLCCFCNKCFGLLAYSVEISLDWHFDISVNWNFLAINIQPLTEVFSHRPEKVPSCCGGNLGQVRKNINMNWTGVYKCALWFVGV